MRGACAVPPRRGPDIASLRHRCPWATHPARSAASDHPSPECASERLGDADAVAGVAIGWERGMAPRATDASGPADQSLRRPRRTVCWLTIS